MFRNNFFAGFMLQAFYFDATGLDAVSTILARAFGWDDLGVLNRKRGGDDAGTIARRRGGDGDIE